MVINMYNNYYSFLKRHVKLSRKGTTWWLPRNCLWKTLQLQCVHAILFRYIHQSIEGMLRLRSQTRLNSQQHSICFNYQPSTIERNQRWKVKGLVASILPSPKRTANAPENRPGPQKGNNRIPTIHFQVLLLLVSGRVIDTTRPVGHSTRVSRRRLRWLWQSHQQQRCHP